MRHIRLVSFEDEPTGNLGLGFPGCTGSEIFADSSGMLTAHDLLEHQNGVAAIGCPGDELQALGGVWQVRGRHGDLQSPDNRGRCVYEALANDVMFVANDLTGCGWWPGTKAYNTRPHDYDDDFDCILEQAAPLICAEFRGDSDRDDFPHEAFLADAKHLMRIGFNKARRRFGMDYTASNTYRAVAAAVGRVAKHLEFPGQEFRLSYGAGEARCTEIDHGEW